MATALITGASSGLGRELARLCARDGHDVVLVARREDRLRDLAAELESQNHVRAHVIALDLASAGAADTLVTEVDGRDLDIEILINNAGFGGRGSFHDQDPARALDMIQVNIAAVVGLTRAILPKMLARKRGRILNIGSTAGFSPGPFTAVYFASKAFVNSFTESLAYELRGSGVTATVSCPGATATEFAARAGGRKPGFFGLGVAAAPKVARQAYRAMLIGRPLVVHGALNIFATQAIRFLPRALVRAMVGALKR